MGLPPAWDEKTVELIVANPFYAIQIAPTLCEPHPRLISREQWITANERMIAELGPRRWLERLLSCLEGHYV